MLADGEGAQRPPRSRVCHTGPMTGKAAHTADAPTNGRAGAASHWDGRTKILLLAEYTVALFLAVRLKVLAVLALALGAVAAVSGVNGARVLRQAAPSYVIAVFLLLYNGVAAGWAEGVLVAGRVVLLVYASLVVAALTTPTELTEALRRFLQPLARCGLPVHDGVTALSLALRFMPLMAQESAEVRTAQLARGAALESGSLAARLRAWGQVMVPVLVGLFRRADRLACAMDARCFGASKQPTTLAPQRFGLQDGLALLVGLAVIAALLALR